MEFPKITIQDVKSNDINKALKKAKKRIFVIINDAIITSLRDNVTFRQDQTEPVEMFAKTVANEHASNLLNGDNSVSQMLMVAFDHIESASDPSVETDEQEKERERAEDLISDVNQEIKTSTQNAIDLVTMSVYGNEDNRFDFDKLLKLHGVTWEKVSNLYKAIDENLVSDIEYAKAFIKHEVSVKRAENKQELWLTHKEIRDSLMEEVVESVYDDRPQPKQYLDDLIETVVSDETILKPVDLSTMHLDEKGYANAKYYDEFELLFSSLSERVNHSNPLISKHDDLDKLSRIIEEVEMKNGFPFNIEQKEGIFAACQNSVFSLTGLAGTGKSTSVKAIVEIFNYLYRNDPHARVMGASFTGQATYNLRQSVGFDSEHCATMHRWLACNDFMKPEDNPLPSYSDVRLLIIDEFSMVDLSLINKVLMRLKDNKDVNILFVGDIGQLPSINVGFALDFTKSNIGQQIEYKTIVRQKEDSIIPKMANDVRNGKTPKGLVDEHSRAKQFRFISEVGYEAMVERSANTYLRYVTKYPDNLKGMQILTNTNALVKQINERVQKKLIKETDLINPDISYRTDGFEVNVGDRVVFTMNMTLFDENKTIFNGAKGTVTDIQFDDSRNNMFSDDTLRELADIKSITIDFDAVDELGSITFEDNLEPLRYIRLSYATTTHKSQGSTIDNIILTIGRAPQLNSRQLVYTGLTRTSNTLTLISSPNIIKESIENDVYAKARLIYKDIVKEINKTQTVD